MNNDHAESERRKEQRFKVNEQAIAVLKVGNNFSRLGRIVDVSLSGLAFDYLLMDGVPQQLKRDDEVGEISMNIITEDGHMVLVGAAVQPVNDRLLQREERFFASVPTSRCAVHFNSLSAAQGEQLGEFILQRAVLNS